MLASQKNQLPHHHQVRRAASFPGIPGSRGSPGEPCIQGFLLFQLFKEVRLSQLVNYRRSPVFILNLVVQVFQVFHIGQVFKVFKVDQVFQDAQVDPVSWIFFLIFRDCRWYRYSSTQSLVIPDIPDGKGQYRCSLLTWSSRYCRYSRKFVYSKYPG